MDEIYSALWKYTSDIEVKIPEEEIYALIVANAYEQLLKDLFVLGVVNSTLVTEVNKDKEGYYIFDKNLMVYRECGMYVNKMVVKIDLKEKEIVEVRYVTDCF